MALFRGFVFFRGRLSVTLFAKSTFMAGVRVGHRFWLFGVMPSSAFAIAKK
jgi:hypothetical protein